MPRQSKLPPPWSWGASTDGKLWLTQALGHGWTARFQIEPTDHGDLRVGEVVIGPSSPLRPPTGELTTRLLRNLHAPQVASLSGAAVQEALDTLRPLARRGSATAKALVDALTRRGFAGSARRRRPPKAPTDNELFLAQFAADYVAEVTRTRGRRYRDALAERYGESPERVRDLVSECRRRMLTPSTHGKAGGVLTPYAEQILRSTTTKGRKR